MNEQSSVPGRVLSPAAPVKKTTTSPQNVGAGQQAQAGVNQPPPPPPGSQPQQQVQPQPIQPQQAPQPPVDGSSKFPIKKLLIGLGILIAITVAVLMISRLIGKEEPSSGPVKLVWWGHSWDAELLEPFLTEYTEETGVEIEYVSQSTTDYRERLANSLAQGTGPDIFEYHNSWVAAHPEQLSPLPDGVMSVEEFSRTFFSPIVADMSVGDSIYGMPISYDGLVLFVNDFIFSTAQVDYPTDWDDVRQLASIMTQTSGSQIIQSGLAMGSTINVDHWPEIIALLLLQNSVDLNNPVGEDTIAAIEYFNQFGKGEVWDETLPNSTQAFAQGKVAMYFAPSYRAEEIMKLNPNLKFRAISLPQLPQDEVDIPGSYYATYWVNGVSKKSVHSTPAWEFLKHLSSRDVQRKLYEVRAKSGLGFVYPRNDLVPLVAEHKYFGPVVDDITSTTSWYLADYTHDGDTGINTLMNSVYELAILEGTYKILPTDVASVLAAFGIAPR